jgi:hypothetical protein
MKLAISTLALIATLVGLQNGLAKPPANLAPVSLAGYEISTKETGSKGTITFTYGANTFAQAGSSSDTNLNDFTAGDYTYLPTSPTTGVITNTDVSFMEDLGTTNVVAVYVTFKSTSAGSYTWTNNANYGSGTFKLSALKKNLVPDTLAGKILHLGGNGGPVMTFDNAGNYSSTQHGLTHTGTYTFTQFSPTVGVIDQVFTGDEAGAIGYIFMDFSSAKGGYGVGNYYTTPAFGSNPDYDGHANFTLK